MTQHIVAITLMIYYSEMIQCKIGKEKDTRNEIRRKAGTGFHEFLLVESQRTFKEALLQQQVITIHLPNVVCHGSSQRLNTPGFYWKHFLPSAYPKLKTPRRKAGVRQKPH